MAAVDEREGAFAEFFTWPEINDVLEKSETCGAQLQRMKEWMKVESISGSSD